MQLWTWHQADQPFLTCALLPQPHGFFTKHFYPAAPEELVRAIANANTQVYRVKQVHSGDVLLTDSPQVPLPLADGMVTQQPNQSVWACSADCTPALIADVKTGQVAAVHAGWRGTAKQIVPAAVNRLRSQGSQLPNIRIALGPAIDGQVYQVGPDVASEVGATVAPTIDGEKLAEKALLDHLLTIKNPPLLSDRDPDRVRLDVRRINQMQLLAMGLELAQIAIAPHCTYQEPENFFSYRRTHEKKVQWAGIVSI
ncbi:MAG: peptidoglycan editing factor PgeF [Phormidesmis sp.]